jgi:hypothetical protein
MTANNDTYIASVKAAAATKTLAVAAAIATFESTITAAKNDIGYREGFPTSYATFLAAVNAANTAKLAALADAERAKQGAVMQNARCILDYRCRLGRDVLVLISHQVGRSPCERIRSRATFATITIYDNTVGSGTKIGTITVFASTNPHFIFDIHFWTGLTIVTATATPDITVSFT